MFGLGPTELIVILVLALLVLGPKRIPEAASSLGKAIRGFRRATRELRDQIDIDDDVRRPFEDLRSALRDEPPRMPVMAPLITAPGDDTFPRIPNDDAQNGIGHFSNEPTSLPVPSLVPPSEATIGTTPATDAPVTPVTTEVPASTIPTSAALAAASVSPAHPFAPTAEPPHETPAVEGTHR